MVPATKNKHPTRGQQPYTSGLGKVFTTPTKRRNKHKSTTLVAPIGLNIRQKRLMDDIQRLKTLSASTALKSCSDATLEKSPSKDDPDSLDALDLSLEPTCGVPFNFDGRDIDAPVSLDPKIRRTLPDATAHELYDRWIARLPSLVSSLSLYVTRTTGVHLEPITSLKSTCMKGQLTCHRKTSTIMCLFFDRTFTISLFVLTTAVITIIFNPDFKNFNIESCECVDIFHVLVSNGLFPTSPLRPRMAVSINLLDFYDALFERSCDAVNAMASALNTYYTRRGFVLLNAQVGLPLFFVI